MFEDDPVLEWEVRTESIPVADGQGKEITVNFYSPSIINDGAFYTDANGMEMQKRKLRFGSNHIVTPADISASFYPVTAAIVLRDTEVESLEDLAVMTTRT